MWAFLIVSTLAWGIAEIFYKKGSLEKEKYSHLKTTVFVGIFMGIYATVILFTQDVDLASFPINLVRYLPVALCYIVSMTCSYFGVRFIQESISDPIENTSGAIVPILCAIFLHEEFEPLAIAAIVVVAVGILCIGFFDKKGKEDRNKRLGKTLAVWAIAMPFCYMLLDAVGTFLDIFYTDSVDTTLLINVTEENLEHTANCAYEFTFFLISMGILIFLKAKGEKLFSIKNKGEENVEVDANGQAVVVKENIWQKILSQKWKILAAIFETIGQATYLFALSEGEGIAAVILGAGTVIVSFILSRIFLKEKLSWLQYIFIAVIFAGIIMLSFVG
ncbi:MAG: DMT family transporter [Clostridiales bacterium]|nr:DMT family transporter [Clostridiales bacterium]